MKTYNLTSTRTLNLGDTGEGIVGSWVVQVSGTFSGSLVLLKRIKGGIVADGSAAPTYYLDHAAGTSVPANTPITAAALVIVPCAGCDLILSYTHTSGTCVVEVEPLLG